MLVFHISVIRDPATRSKIRACLIKICLRYMYNMSATKTDVLQLREPQTGTAICDICSTRQAFGKFYRSVTHPGLRGCARRFAPVWEKLKWKSNVVKRLYNCNDMVLMIRKQTCYDVTTNKNNNNITIRK